MLHACPKSCQYTKVLAVKGGRDGVRVNSIAPGVIDTPIFDGYAEAGLDVAKLLKVQAKLHALGRVGQPEEVAELICFLASSKAAGFITGDVIMIDGGASISTKMGTYALDRKAEQERVVQSKL